MKFSKNFIKAGDKLCTFEEFVAAPYFRKKFKLEFKPENAEITICGLGFYELYINGVNVTKGPLAPYISNPDDICYYDNYDITKLSTFNYETIQPVIQNCGIILAFGIIYFSISKIIIAKKVKN